MFKRITIIFAITVMLGLLPVMGSAALAPYSQDFEGLVQSDLDALGDDGWLAYGNVFDSGGGYLYGYGPYPAPNHGSAFSAIVLEQGGEEQGAQQLSVFSDYENVDHANGFTIESNVYREWTVGPEDVGSTWVFAFQCKMGNLEPVSTAAAFIKTLDPSNGWALTNFITEDTTGIPETWGGYGLVITIDAGLEGQILQIGFMNTATLYQSSGIFYDNVEFGLSTGVNDSTSPALIGATLSQNFPNPFNPKTRIEFELQRSTSVDLAVFDIEGRRITTLFRGLLDAGSYQEAWDGRTDRGIAAPSGQYWYRLKTATGEISRSMLLMK
jgi:hypothetical protein